CSAVGDCTSTPLVGSGGSGRTAECRKAGSTNDRSEIDTTGGRERRSVRRRLDLVLVELTGGGRRTFLFAALRLLELALLALLFVAPVLGAAPGLPRRRVRCEGAPARSRARLTFTFRPRIAVPSRVAIACWALSADSYSPKPKPRGRPVSRSV